MSAPRDPWEAERARYGHLAPTYRKIDVAAGTDEFVPLQALRDCGELLLDGCTLIAGLERGLSWEERQALIERCDAAWRERQAAEEAARRR